MIPPEILLSFGCGKGCCCWIEERLTLKLNEKAEGSHKIKKRRGEHHRLDERSLADDVKERLRFLN